IRRRGHRCVRALKLLSTIFLLNIIISVQPVHAEEEKEDSPSEDTVETSPTIQTNAAEESAGENVSPEEESNGEEESTTEPPAEEENPEAPKENEEIDNQLKESDEQVLDAVRVEEKPNDYNNYNTNVNVQQEFDNNSSEVVEDNTVVSKEDYSKDKTNNNKKDSKKKTPHGAKELPNTGIHENIELIYVLEIVLLTLGLLLLFRKSSKVKIRK